MPSYQKRNFSCLPLIIDITVWGMLGKLIALKDAYLELRTSLEQTSELPRRTWLNHIFLRGLLWEMVSLIVEYNGKYILGCAGLRLFGI